MPHPRTLSRKPTAVALSIAMLASLGLAACGSSGASSTTSARTAANAAASSATTPGGTSSGGTSSGGTSSDATSSGTTASKSAVPGRPNPTHLPDNHFRRAHRAFDSPRFHQTLVRFAACLRRNGIAVGEPNTTGKGPVFSTKGINTGSSQFRAAAVKCRSTLFSGPRPKTAHPGVATG